MKNMSLPESREERIAKLAHNTSIYDRAPRLTSEQTGKPLSAQSLFMAQRQQIDTVRDFVLSLQWESVKQRQGLGKLNGEKKKSDKESADLNTKLGNNYSTLRHELAALEHLSDERDERRLRAITALQVQLENRGLKVNQDFDAISYEFQGELSIRDQAIDSLRAQLEEHVNVDQDFAALHSQFQADLDIRDQTIADLHADFVKAVEKMEESTMIMEELKKDNISLKTSNVDLTNRLKKLEKSGNAINRKVGKGWGRGGARNESLTGDDEEIGGRSRSRSPGSVGLSSNVRIRSPIRDRGRKSRARGDIPGQGSDKST